IGAGGENVDRPGGTGVGLGRGGGTGRAGTDVDAGIQRLAAAGVDAALPGQLARDHRRQPQALAGSQRLRQLLVVHVAEDLVLVGEQRVAEAGVAHALDQHLRELAFELARGMFHPRDVGSGLGRQFQRAGVDAHQITSSSARSAPACFRASRMAIRSPGAAPTSFTARTISSRVVPPSKRNMRLPSCALLMEEVGAATVPPPAKAPGWLTCTPSLMVTVNAPWVTAAGITRTCEPITTVPVRALTMTLAGAVPGVSSRFSIWERKLMRMPGSDGADTATVTPSTARATPGPYMRLIASTMRATVVKSVRCRLRVRSPPASSTLGRARSMVAPLGMRPVLGMLTATREPSRPWAPKPPTTRLPWAMA